MKRRILGTGIILFVSLVSALASARLEAGDKSSDWPQFRGPTGQGVSADKGVPVTWTQTENVVWKVELPGSGASSPIIVGKRIWLTCFTGFTPGQGSDMARLKLHLVCLGRDKGNLLWNKEIAPKLPEEARMRENHGYASSTPAADAERVYCFFGKSGTVAFDHDGRELWRADVGARVNGFGSGASPMLHGDVVIVNASAESESVVALDKKTGKEVWRANGIREAWNTPITVTTPDGRTELVVAIAGKLLGLDPATGAQLWSCNTDIGWYMVPSMVAHEGVVYALGGRSGVVGLAVRAGGKGDVTRSHRLWTSKKGSNVSSPLLHEGHLYWMNDNLGIAYCALAKTGDIVYEERLPRASQVYASPVLADGKIYYLSRTGQTFVVAATPRFESLAVNNLGERSTFDASPAIAGGQLFVRSQRYLYCLGRK